MILKLNIMNKKYFMMLNKYVIIDNCIKIASNYDGKRE